MWFTIYEDKYVPTSLLLAVGVRFSQANYSVPENGGVAEIVVEADKDFSFSFQVQIHLMPGTAQCKHYLLFIMCVSVNCSFPDFLHVHEVGLLAVPHWTGCCTGYYSYS